MATGLGSLFKKITTSAGRAQRGPSMAAALRQLLKLGVPVGSVIDVGVQTGTDPLTEVLRDRHHLLIEPVEEWNDAIKQHYEAHGVQYSLLNIAASDADGEVKLKLKSVLPGEISSHAFMVEEEKGEGEYRSVPMRRLDSVIAEQALAGPFLLKVDVDGAEMRVIDGALDLLKSCSTVSLEVGVNNMVERLSRMRELGFEPFDIVDICYYDDRFVQVDVVFINLKYVKELNLEFYRDGFDAAKWKRYIED
jgi:FkbM family methyltransferase